MNKRIFISSLPYETTQDEVKGLFSPFGNVVSVTIIIDKFTGRSKGFGFVEMESEEESSKAINELNGTEFGGRKLIVAEAKPMEERRDRYPSNTGFRSGGGSGFGRRESFGRRDGGRGGFGGDRGSRGRPGRARFGR